MKLGKSFKNKVRFSIFILRFFGSRLRKRKLNLKFYFKDLKLKYYLPTQFKLNLNIFKMFN